MSKIAIYHHNDFDGRCAAAIALQNLEKEHEVQTIEVNYGYDFAKKEEKFEGASEVDVIYFVDFSPSDEHFAALMERPCNVVIIDHHKSAIEKFENIENDKLLKFMKEGLAGCELTQIYFDNDVSEVTEITDDMVGALHPAVRMLGRYDVWDHEDPSVLSFQYGMSMVVTELNEDLGQRMWAQLLASNTEEEKEMSQQMMLQIINMGAVILNYKADQDEFACKRGFESTLQGHKVFVVNTISGDSYMFENVENKEDYDFFVFYYQVEPNKFKYSLRTVKGSDFDTTKVAELYGGGGHPGASGFVSDTNLFENKEWTN